MSSAVDLPELTGPQPKSFFCGQERFWQNGFSNPAAVSLEPIHQKSVFHNEKNHEQFKEVKGGQRGLCVKESNQGHYSVCGDDSFVRSVKMPGKLGQISTNRFTHY